MLSWGGREEGWSPEAGELAPELLGVDEGLLNTAWSLGWEIRLLAWCCETPWKRVGLLHLWVPEARIPDDIDFDILGSPCWWQWQCTCTGIGRWNELIDCNAPKDRGWPGSIWKASCSSLSSANCSFNFLCSSSSSSFLHSVFTSASPCEQGLGVVDVVDEFESTCPTSVTAAILDELDERWQKGWCRLLNSASSSSITASSSPLASPLAVSDTVTAPSGFISGWAIVLVEEPGADDEWVKDASPPLAPNDGVWSLVVCAELATSS